MSDAERFLEALRRALAAPWPAITPVDAGPAETWSPLARRFREAIRRALEHPPEARAEGTPAAEAFPLARHFAKALREALGRPAAADTTESVPSSPRSMAARRFQEALQDALDRQPEATADDAPAATNSPLARQFDDALRRALDPANVGSAESARTTGYSPWIMRACSVCGHTIREDDLVWLAQRDGQTEAVHDSTELPCRSGAESAEPQQSPAAAAFSAALRQAYPGISVRKIVRLRPGHPLLSSQYRNGRARCRGCGHTFRPFERVSICPCSPLEPREGCRFPAHNDPAVSQLCFELLAEPTRKHCPRDFSPR